MRFNYGTPATGVWRVFDQDSGSDERSEEWANYTQAQRRVETLNLALSAGLEVVMIDRVWEVRFPEYRHYERLMSDLRTLVQRLEERAEFAVERSDLASPEGSGRVLALGEAVGFRIAASTLHDLVWNANNRYDKGE